VSVDDQNSVDDDHESSIASTVSSYCLVLAICLVALGLFAKNKWPVFGAEPSLFPALFAVWVISAGLLEWLVRTRFGTRSEQGFALFFLAIALANVTPFCRALNAAFDRATPVAVQAKVSGTREITGRRSYYYINVQPEGDHAAGEIMVSYGLYDQLSTGEHRVTFRLFKGAFGWPWVDGLAVVKTGQ